MFRTPFFSKYNEEKGIKQMAHLVITIGCEYGAKGNQIGKKVSGNKNCFSVTRYKTAVIYAYAVSQRNISVAEEKVIVNRAILYDKFAELLTCLWVLDFTYRQFFI